MRKMKMNEASINHMLFRSIYFSFVNFSSFLPAYIKRWLKATDISIVYSIAQ
jgi:hypothetical protein